MGLLGGEVGLEKHTKKKGFEHLVFELQDAVHKHKHVQKGNFFKNS